MEIKTDKEIVERGVYIKDKKWVAVDDLKEEIIRIANDELGGEISEIEPFKILYKSLSTSQSEGTELSFKVPSDKASDKILCPKCRSANIENGVCSNGHKISSLN